MREHVDKCANVCVKVTKVYSTRGGCIENSPYIRYNLEHTQEVLDSQTVSRVNSCLTAVGVSNLELISSHNFALVHSA